MPIKAMSPSISVAEVCFVLLFLVLVSAAASLVLVPPAVIRASAPQDMFSAERACKHLEFIAREPHPTGSAANARVRDYLIQQLQQQGLKPQVQRTSIASLLDIFPGPYAAGTVENIASRLRGTASTGVVLLMAHYDSVATAPGATDDGSGVVTLLETLRVLKSGPPLRNDLIFLFTDGEELGEVGSQGFVSEHPWAKQVSAVWNLDSGGSCGAAGIDLSNGWALRKLRKVIPHPLAASIGGELDKLGPPEGDDTLVFNPVKVVIARSGYSGCYYRYHTAKDNISSIDPRSVQHLGLYTLTVVREWGNADLGEIRGFPPSVFFVVLGRIISYPATLARAMSVLLLVFYSFVVLFGLKLSRLSVGGLAFVVLLWILFLFTCAGLTVAIWWALKTLHLVNFSYSSAYNAEIYATAFVVLAAAGGSALYLWSRSKTNPDNLLAGGLFWCLILSMLSSWLAPGISFLFSWPLLFGLISLTESFRQRPRALANIFRLLCSFPAIFLLVPLIVYSISHLAGDPGSSLVVCVIFAILCLTFLAPQIESISTLGGLRLSLAVALVGAGLLCWGALHSGYDSEHPRPDTIAYWLDADTGTTSWISIDDKPDVWTSQFFPAHVTSDTINIFADPGADRVLKSDAPRIPLSAPEIVLLDDVSVAGLRKLRLRLISARRADNLWVAVQNATLREATIDSKKVPSKMVDPEKKLWGFYYAAPPVQGIELMISFNASEKPRITLSDGTTGLPTVPGFQMAPRTPNFMPLNYFPAFDFTTLASKTLVVP